MPRFSYHKNIVAKNKKYHHYGKVTESDNGNRNGLSNWNTRVTTAFKIVNDREECNYLKSKWATITNSL